MRIPLSSVHKQDTEPILNYFVSHTCIDRHDTYSLFVNYKGNCPLPLKVIGCRLGFKITVITNGLTLNTLS